MNPTVHAASYRQGTVLLSVVVVERLAGRNATPALQASFAQQCVHHAVGKPARTQHQSMQRQSVINLIIVL